MSLRRIEDTPMHIWPNGIDVFTLIISIILIVVVLLMIYWMGMLCYRTFRTEMITSGAAATSVEEPSTETPTLVREMRYLGEADRSESTPLDWKIERPKHLRSERRTRPSSRHETPKRPRQPILSDIAVGKTININDAEKGILPRKNDDAEKLESRPVLNVIWEPSQGDYAMEYAQEKGAVPKIHKRQLISATPILVKKRGAAGHEQTTEPVLVKLYYEPGEGEDVEIPTIPLSKTKQEYSAPGPVPSVSSKTTRTRTRVFEPSPGYTKKVTETLTIEKEVTRTPGKDEAEGHGEPERTPVEEGGNTDQNAATSPEMSKEKKKRLGKVLALSSETIGEEIKRKTPKPGRRSRMYAVKVPQVPPPCPSEPVILMTPDVTQDYTSPVRSKERVITKMKPLKSNLHKNPDHRRRNNFKTKTNDLQKGY
ncbi:unnamed protein product [Cylicocyclus nassatus]|uniref:Uncharacterized protein n=1 Tax=Cylicocyclus nassatus TaxID=53992 RepID=A0AA36HCV7_CYLNA|nr:unnamed protein product [Cylicocyclus nassatus]